MNTPLRAPEKDNFQERKSRVLHMILEGCVFVRRCLKIFWRSANIKCFVQVVIGRDIVMASTDVGSNSILNPTNDAHETVSFSSSKLFLT